MILPETAFSLNNKCFPPLLNYFRIYKNSVAVNCSRSTLDANHYLYQKKSRAVSEVMAMCDRNTENPVTS